VVISLSVLAAVGLAGGALAASRSDSSPRGSWVAFPQGAFINDAARRIHVIPARLSQALRQAQVDQIKAGAAAGCPGPPPSGGRTVRRFAVPGLVGPPFVLPAAAQYLGLSVQQLVGQLASGK